uniref:Uncharacterized protein n=1 Tax=Ascaris lumbricoides TaxID=6252 RepID=A0A0M3I6S2_ASCLU
MDDQEAGELVMLPSIADNSTSSTTTLSTISASSEDHFFEIPIIHHLVPVIIMVFILLLLLLASLYDCKVNRDCFRKQDGNEDVEAPKPQIYLYDGRTGESRPSNRP